MSRYVTDTHALYWYLIGSSNLSPKMEQIFRESDTGINQILIPSIVLVEMVYLEEKGRISSASVNKVLGLLETAGGSYEVASLTKEIVIALQKVPRDKVPDMPDRIIAATAYQVGFPLITRDSKIKESGIVKVIW